LMTVALEVLVEVWEPGACDLGHIVTCVHNALCESGRTTAEHTHLLHLKHIGPVVRVITQQCCLFLHNTVTLE